MFSLDTQFQKSDSIDSFSVSKSEDVSNATDQFESVCFETTCSEAVITQRLTLLTSVNSIFNVVNFTFPLKITEINWAEEDLDLNADHLLLLRVTSLAPVFSPLNVDTGRMFTPLRDASFRRLWKRLFSANHRKYYIPSSRREKRKLRFLYISGAGVSSDETKETIIPGKDKVTFEFALKYCVHVVFVFSVECVITSELWQGVLPLTELLIAAVFNLITATCQTFCYHIQAQSKRKTFLTLKEFLDAKILELELLANNQSKEAYFTLRIELPGLYVFLRELQQITDTLHSGFANLLCTIYSAKLCSIENAMNFHQCIYNQASCDCPESNCSSQAEYDRLLDVSGEMESLEYRFLSLVCSNLNSLKEIQTLSLECEKFVERLSSVTAGQLCSNADKVRSVRKFLYCRAEILQSKLSLLLKETPPGTYFEYGETSKKCEDHGDQLNWERHGGGGKLCCISGCRNSAGEHPVSHLTGRYEIEPEIGKETWFLYVCDIHYEQDKATHRANTEIPETRVVFSQVTRLICNICQQSKNLYSRNTCVEHFVNIFDKRVQLPCDSASTFDIHKEPGSVQAPPLDYVCKKCSTSILVSRTLQVPQELCSQFSLNPIMEGIHHAMTNNFLHEMMGWSVSVDQKDSLQFQFSPQRGETLNLNERVLHLFIQGSELHYQAYMLNAKVNIKGSLGKVEQSVAAICSNLYKLLKKTENEKICCGVHDGNILCWAKEKIGSPHPPQFIVDSQWTIPVKKGDSTEYLKETVRKAKVSWEEGTLHTGVECQILAKERSKSGRCEVCQKMFDHSLRRHKKTLLGNAENATKPDSKVKFSALSITTT